MPNEITIRVKAINDTKTVFDAVRAESRKLGDDIAVEINKTTTERLNREAQASAGGSGGYAQAGDRIGRVMGDRISERITERINVNVRDRINNSRSSSDSSSRSRSSGGSDRDREHVTVDVDVDKQSFLQRLAGLGNSVREKISGFFSDGIGAGITSVFSGDLISTTLKAGVIGLATFVLAPAIGAALTSGILLALGGGAIAAGIASAIKNSPTITDALTSVKDKAKNIFNDFGGYFKGPLYDFIQMASQLLDSMKPSINALGAALAPVADSLAHGVIGFLQNALPGIMRAMEASAPLIKTLADELPGIGDAIGRFFDHVSHGAPNANKFFNDLLNILPIVIRVIGVLIEAFTELYGMARYAFFTMLNIAATWAVGITSAARIAFGWVPGLGPKLDAAAGKAAEFKQKVNRQLSGIHDVDIDVRIRTWGLNTALSVLDVTRQLRAVGAIGRATGGVIGQAATGGARNGLTWVGERGPELIDAAPGSRVYSNADSMRMAGQGGGGGWGSIIVPLIVDGREIARAMINPQRDIIRNEYGGNVQAAYGT